LIEQILVNYIPWMIGIGGVIIFFWQFRKWNIDKLKQSASNERSRLKDSDKVLDKDIQQYIANPEATIEALMKQRIIKEKSNDKKGIDMIDNQIKMLQVLAQIPAPARPYVAQMGQALMKKVTGIVNDFG